MFVLNFVGLMLLFVSSPYLAYYAFDCIQERLT